MTYSIADSIDVIFVPSARSLSQYFRDNSDCNLINAAALSPIPVSYTHLEPAYVRYVAQRLAEVKNVDEAEIARVTMKNAKRFFDIESGLE